VGETKSRIGTVTAYEGSMSMNRRSFLGGLAVGVAGLGAGASVAQAQVYGRWEYRRYHYIPGYGAEMRHRQYLRDRLFELGDHVHQADRDGAIPREEANRLFDKLDRVRDFLRNDTYLDPREFERRQDDLNDVSRRLREALHRSGRHYDYDRNDRRDRDRDDRDRDRDDRGRDDRDRDGNDRDRDDRER
jgi:hypothetical protein